MKFVFYSSNDTSVNNKSNENVLERRDGAYWSITGGK